MSVRKKFGRNFYLPLGLRRRPRRVKWGFCDSLTVRACAIAHVQTLKFCCPLTVRACAIAHVQTLTF